MVVYQYQPIDEAGTAIRLLKLLRAQRGEGILCEIFDAYLDETTNYEALSYTWGSQCRRKQIHISGAKMLVTDNLFTALTNLRLVDKDRIIWIDAICVDQDNVRERGHQVKQMRHIYQQASSVVIWLGEATEKIEKLMRIGIYLDSHPKFVRNTDTYNNIFDFYRSLGLRTLINNEKISTEHLEDALHDLLARPWYKRVWVVQEAANARAAVIACGRFIVSTSTFVRLPQIVGIIPEKHCQSILDVLPGRSREKSWWSRDRQLLTLLIKFQDCLATDPRDKVFALLGISSDASNNPRLLVDYSKTLGEVVQDTLSFLFSQARRMYTSRLTPWLLPATTHDIFSSIWKIYLEWDKARMLSEERSIHHYPQPMPRSIREWVSIFCTRADEENPGVSIRVLLNYASQVNDSELTEALLEIDSRITNSF